MKSITLFFTSLHGDFVLWAIGTLFVTTTILSIQGKVRNGKMGRASEKHNIISSFFLVSFGARYTSSYTTYFWLVVIVIIISYLIGFPNF